MSDEVDSPYLSRLLERRQAALDPSTRATVDAELGMYWARCGQSDRAHAIAQELRAEFGDGRSTGVSVMLMILEALIVYFEELSAASVDRLARAHLLATASKRAPLIALTSAWLAHVDFNFERYREMVRAVRDCIDAASPTDDHALCRLSLTLGDAFLLCRDHAASKAWYQRARDHALNLGDHAAIGALTYNQAALGAFLARLDALSGPVDAVALQRLAGEVRSAFNYQAVAKLQSLQGLLDSASVAVRMLSPDHGSGIPALESLLGSSSVVGIRNQRVGLRCDLALCYAQVDRRDDAKAAIRSIDWTSIDALAAGDQAIAYASLREACRRCGLEDQAQRADQRCLASAREHEAQAQALGVSLQPYRSVGTLPGAAARP